MIVYVGEHESSAVSDDDLDMIYNITGCDKNSNQSTVL